MRAIITIIVWTLCLMLPGHVANAEPVFVPAKPATQPECTCDKCEWDAYYGEAYSEYVDEFTALFNSYETKRAKNGALMIRQGNSGSYRFAKKGM